MSRNRPSPKTTTAFPSGAAGQTRVRPRRTVLLALVMAPAALSLSSCVVDGSRRAVPTPTATRRPPTEADLEDFRRRIRALPLVTAVNLSYAKGTFGTPPTTEADILSRTPDQATLNDTLDQTYRMIWASQISLGVLFFAVKNPTTGAYANAQTLGFTAQPAIPELMDRYGVPPWQGGATASPSA